ncbi:hypothetical protein RE093_004278 [Klebsiella pneumoniae]|uniref:hypothetical protein n=1 Tax=Klebsiella pneumoniae TaxID=573 RepID=UPI0023AF80C8|nr:hypothetical protein [Klebsiella pneumoniae]EKZ6576073.1 hypothetical protein [Klebsiella pneumoniae]
MTDITELAQSLKTAAIDAKELAIIARYSKGRAAAEKFYALANPNNVLALVDALEKAQAKADVYDMLRDDYGLREKGVGLADFVDWQAKCIAELESRTVTVKLPKPHAHLIWIQAGHAPDDYWDDVAVSHSEKDRCCDGSERYPVYARWEIEEMLAAAGIKVEAE